MADDVSLELWMDRRRLTALERVLKENGGAMAVKNEVGVEGECEA